MRVLGHQLYGGSAYGEVDFVADSENSDDHLWVETNEDFKVSSMILIIV